jgi:hypothetical protein
MASKPKAVPAPPATIVSPFTDNVAWGEVWLTGPNGNIKIPGHVQGIEGCDRIQKWVVQLGISATGGVSIWRGTPLVESIKVKVILADEKEFSDYLRMPALFPVLAAGAKGMVPSSYMVKNAAFAFAKISRVGIRCWGTPTVPPGLKCEAVVDLIEYRPLKLAPMGPNDPPRPKSALEQENERLGNEASELLKKASTL